MGSLAPSLSVSCFFAIRSLDCGAHPTGLCMRETEFWGKNSVSTAGAKSHKNLVGNNEGFLSQSLLALLIALRTLQEMVGSAHPTVQWNRNVKSLPKIISFYRIAFWIRRRCSSSSGMFGARRIADELAFSASSYRCCVKYSSANSVWAIGSLGASSIARR